MNCEELRPDYMLFAMGAMEEPERGEMLAHLARGCETCASGVHDARALAYSMGAILDGPEPPRALRGRVLGVSGAPAGSAEARPRLPFWARPIPAWRGLVLAAACLLFALIPAFLWYRQLSESNSRQAAAAARLAGAQRSAATLREQVAKLERDAALRAAPIFSLETVRGAAFEEAPKRVVIPRGSSAIVLALPTDLVRQASAAELRNASGQTVWTVSPLPESDSDSTGLAVAAQLLSPGRYSVVLRAGERTVARLAFQVMAR